MYGCRELDTLLTGDDPFLCLKYHDIQGRLVETNVALNGDSVLNTGDTLDYDKYSSCSPFCPPNSTHARESSDATGYLTPTDMSRYECDK
jgi:hypothetical protein